MRSLEHLVDLAERMFLDELPNLDTAVHDEFQGGGIEIGRAAPITDRPRVERHQVRESDLDLVHGEPNDRQRRTMIDQTKRSFLANTRTRAFKNDPFTLTQAGLLGEFLDRRFNIARRHLFGIQCERGTLLSDASKFFLIHVDRDNGAAKSGGDLNGIATNTADAVDDDKVIFCDSGLYNRLIGRRYRIGDHRKVSQFDSDFRQAVLIDNTKAARRHSDMCREAAMNIVAGHFLVWADRRLTAEAGITSTARDHRRNNNRMVDVPKFIFAGVDDVATDLMPERQRQFMFGTHTIVIVAEVSVANSTPGDFDHDLIGARGIDIELHRNKRLACARHHPTNRLGAHQSALLIGRPARRWPDTRPQFFMYSSIADRRIALIKVKENEKIVF